MASTLPLKSRATTVRFMRHVMGIRKQLRSAKGLVGYTLWAKPLAKRYWTLSVWESEEALRAFMVESPHVEVMKDLAPQMAETHFVQWTARGSAKPPSWDEALARLAE
jgi:heme-degrading monooxygenase HmoA